MKLNRLLILISALLISINAYADRISDSYVSSQGEYGWVYHIFSRQMPSLDNSGVKDLKYDYTYVEHTDSVSFLSTICVKCLNTPSEISIFYCGDTYLATPNLVYVQSSGKNTEFRIRITLPYNIWKDIYSCATPFSVSYNFHRDNKMFKFGIKPKKWKRETELMLSIANIINISTGKQ